MDSLYELSAVAGDAFSLNAEFECAEGEFIFGEHDKAELIIHCGESDRVYEAMAYRRDSAFFSLSGDETEKLLAENPSGRFRYCIRLTIGGTRYTPVHRELFILERC